MSKLVINLVKEFRERQRTINAKHMTNKSKKYRKIHFAVMVLETTAKKKEMGLRKMRDDVLWRKQASIIMLLSKALDVDADRALDLYYSTKTAQQLADPATGLQLMSDQYIVEDILSELQGNQ